ncbi:MAG TPA: hypothetical protein VMT57_04470 [Candidatus Thermoplasmatota archaeon]|nr:hypothetical protein [Candidatus Thermoplasmatota archaeon]
MKGMLQAIVIGSLILYRSAIYSMENAIMPAMSTTSPRLNSPLSKKYCCVEEPSRRLAMIQRVPISKKIVEVLNFFSPDESASPPKRR